MLKKISSLPFNGTPEQEAQLVKFIDGIRTQQGCLMPIMQEAQSIYGYLPFEIQQKIADGMKVPLEKVYGVATFYAQFSLEPKGDYVIAVCQGTACYVKGGAAVLARVEEELGITSNQTTPDGKFSIQDTRCLGCCGLAPVMTINEDVYGKLTPAMVKDILAKY